MKNINKGILLILVAVMLTSCNKFLPTSKTQPTQEMQTAFAIVRTAIAETQRANPTLTSTATLTPLATPLPSVTILPPTKIPTTKSSPIPVSGIPTIIVLANGITWTECVAPSEDYAHSVEDDEFASICLNMQRPVWDDNDRKMAELVPVATVTMSNSAIFQRVIGNDVFLVKQDGTNGCCDYEFVKNGKLIFKTTAPMVTFNPNQHLWSIDGKAVWEIITDPPTIIVDGVDFNEKYQLEGIFKPYSIDNKLIYIAKQNGKYHIVYNEKTIGPEFEEIYIKYCCGTTNVDYGKGKYWFWGRREGTYYVVAIH